MTISSIFHNCFKVAAILGLTAALSACSTSNKNKSEDTANVEKVVAPTAEQETKNLPKGLLPDTEHAVHSAD